MWFACDETCDGSESDPAGSNELRKLRELRRRMRERSSPGWG